MDSSTLGILGCEVNSVAGRVGSSYSTRLSGPETVSGTVVYSGGGLFTAEYIGPIAGDYELEVRPGRVLRSKTG